MKLVDPRHPELEQAIIDAPDDPAGYAVYADWLQTQNDPRGTLMAAMLVPEPRTAEQDAAITRELAAHPSYYYGEMAWVRTHDLLTWTHGFIRNVELRASPPDRLLEQLLGHPSGRFLVRIHLDNNSIPEIESIIDVLERRRPPTLREIRISTTTNVDLSRLWATVPRLRELFLIGTRCRVGTLAVPELEWLRLAEDAVVPHEISTFTRATWPRLARLDLLGADRAWLDELPDMLERTPNLTHLEIERFGDIGAFMETLPTHRIASQLVTLSLNHNTMTDAQAIELARHGSAFGKLARINVYSNRLSATGKAAIATLAPDAWV